MTDQIQNENRRTSTAFVVFVIAALTLSHIHQGTLGVDAIRYASISRHIVETGTWFPLYDSYAQEVYYNKPPVLFWMVATCFKLFGYSTFSARIIGALFTFGGMLLFWAAVRRFYSDRIALYSIIILAANADFFRSIVDLNFEGILLCGGALLLHAGLNRVRNGRFCGEDRTRIVFGLVLFFITKPPVVLFVVPAYLSFELASMFKDETIRRILRRLFLAAVVCAAGFAVVLTLIPIDLVINTLRRQLLEPFIFTQSYGDNLSAWVKNIFVFLIPASLVGIAAVCFPLPEDRRVIPPAERRFLLLWLLPVIAVVFVTESRTRYLHIPFLALAVLGAEYLAVIWGNTGFIWTKRVVGAAAPALLIGIMFGLPLHGYDPVIPLLTKHPELLDANPTVCAGGRLDGDIYAPSVKRLDLLIQFTFNRKLNVIPVENLGQVFESDQPTVIIANRKCVSAIEDPRWNHTVILKEPGVEVVRTGPPAVPSGNTEPSSPSLQSDKNTPELSTDTVPAGR